MASSSALATLHDILMNIWSEKNIAMAWDRIPRGHVVGERQTGPFERKKDYVVVRLGSLFLSESRRLWLKMSPLAHATVTVEGRTDSAVIGPAQFGDLATAPADRSVILHQRLAGPTVYRGGDINLDVGLFAVSKDQAVGALLSTLSNLSALGIPALQQGVELAGIVKAGVEGVLGLEGTKPVLGARTVLKDPATASAGEEAEPCVLVGISAAWKDVKFDELWVKDGRLYSGSSAASLKPYEAHDYVLVVVERGASREDWRGFPSLLAHEESFATILASGDADAQRTARLNTAFAAFDQDLRKEQGLTDPDKDRIRGLLIADIKERMSPGPFAQTKSGGKSLGASARFDFLDVGRSPGQEVKPALEGSLPFPPQSDRA